MGLPELQGWVQANGADPTAAAYQVGQGPRTLAEAIAAGHDTAIAEAVNRSRRTLTIGRGRIGVEAFLAEWTPAMDAALDAAQHRWLALQLGSGSIDVNSTGAAPLMVLVAFPVTRQASAAEVHLGHPLGLDEVAALVNRARVATEQRKVVDAAGVVLLATFYDDVEVERHPHPDGLGIDPKLADPAMTEQAINAALRLDSARKVTDPPIFTAPTAAERAAFVASRKVKTGQLRSGQWFASTFAVPDGLEVSAASEIAAIEGLMRVAQREGW